MPKELTTVDQKEANNFLIHTLFDYLDAIGYLSIIYSTKGQVPGFTKKNALKAPLSLIKNIARQRVKRITDASKFLFNYTKRAREQYKNLTFQEFYAKINVDDKTTEGEKLALFFLLYQEDYKLHLEKIQENIKHERPPLTGILSLSLAEKLSTLHSVSYQIDKLEKINYADHFKLDEKIDHDNLVNNLTLNEKIKLNPLPPPNRGYYLSVYNQYLNESDQWKDSEKTAFLHLVIGDLLRLVENQSQIHNEENKKIQAELHSKQNEYLQMKEIIQKKDTKISSLELKLQDAMKKVADLEAEIDIRSNETEERTKEIKILNETYEKNIEKLKSDYAQLEKLNKALTEERNKFGKMSLFKNEKLYLITKIMNEKFAMILADDQLIHLSKDVDLDDVIKTKEEDAIYFLNVDGISTRESFKLEQPLKNNQLIYRLVSGGIENIIRKMIYYLEGELRDEVKEQH